MLILNDAPTRLCDGLTRREWLRVGGLGMFGLSMPQLLQARQTTPAPKRARSCIVLFLLGGPPQHETWDPKPDAPAEVRGDLKPIATRIPGVQVGELMPLTAQLLDKICVLRAVTTHDSAHSSSGYAMTTGVPHAPRGVENARPGAPNDWPCMGAVVRHLTRKRGGLPAAITLPERLANDGNKLWPGQDAGFLGPSSNPWILNCDPSAPDFRIPELTLAEDVSPQRLDARMAVLNRIDRRLNELGDSALPDRYSSLARQAVDLLSSPAARRAFDLTKEPDRLRDRYGRTKFGQSVLLARRLVEAGVSLVQVSWSRIPGALNNGHWDTHSKNSEALRKHLMAPMDQAYSALLEDLHQRGLLEDTLVVWAGEFGRTPKINRNAGRDHWGQVFSMALAGGGVRGGQVYGASDRIGGSPTAGVVEPHDLTATVFHCLGFEPGTEMHDALGRPMPISRGRVLDQLF